MIGFIVRRALAAAATAAAGTDSGALPSSGAPRWWESFTPASSEDGARVFDAPADREVKDAAAAATTVAAAAAAGGGGSSKKGSGKMPKEIALELGAAKDWKRDSDNGGKGDALDEKDEAFGKDADKEARSKGIEGTGTGYASGGYAQGGRFLGPCSLPCRSSRFILIIRHYFGFASELGLKGVTGPSF